YLSDNKTGALDKFIETKRRIYGFQHNQLNLSNEQLLKNLQKVQEKFVRNKGVELTKEISKEDINLTIEMETGTGKTYTYINTIYELNKRYNWNKFIIVVPSIAIREGVSKSFEDMEKHFKAEYGKEINHFIFNSSKIEEVNNFERDDGINVMIINNQAFSSDLNKINNSDESDIAPIEKIKRTNPIIIIDEPQSVEGINKNNKTKTKMKSFNSLFTLRYSATHRESYNLIYILDPVDAFNQKLVKKIEVMGVEVKGTTATNTYLYLDEIIISPDKPLRVRIEFEVDRVAGNPKKESKILSEGDKIYGKYSNLEEYRDLGKIETIDYHKNCVIFENGFTLEASNIYGDVNIQQKRRIQIRETIKAHILKEKDNFSKGIKTISLFFIDSVDKYRLYDENNNPLVGE
ncbi:DEAD/DEAH box helicase, partial [bacterium]|nr:DEAD/DEAH box helicase [bacterium]